MKIKDLHPDIDRYLKNDCYCPNEVYSFDGFCVMNVYQDDECELIGKIDSSDDHSGEKIIICKWQSASCTDKNYFLYVMFFVDGEKVIDAIRFDATPNNSAIVDGWVKNGKLTLKNEFDEYHPGETAETLRKIAGLSDGIIISD